MAVTAQGTGTKTVSVVGTAETLLDVAVAGTFTLHVDTNAMADGDMLELRIYQIVLTAAPAASVTTGRGRTRRSQTTKSRSRCRSVTS